MPLPLFKTSKSLPNNTHLCLTAAGPLYQGGMGLRRSPSVSKHAANVFPLTRPDKLSDWVVYHPPSTPISAGMRLKLFVWGSATEGIDCKVERLVSIQDQWAVFYIQLDAIPHHLCHICVPCNHAEIGRHPFWWRFVCLKHTPWAIVDSPECLDRIVWMARYQHVPSLVVMDSNEGLDDPVLDAVVTPRLN